MIKEILDEYEIEELLEIFTPYFYTLKFGIVDKHVYVKKIKKYGRVIALYENNDVVGFATFYCNNNESREAFLSYIGIKQIYSGRGYGKKLMGKVLEICKQNSMTTIKLEVRKENSNAISFYKKLGFIQMTDNKQSIYFSMNL